MRACTRVGVWVCVYVCVCVCVRGCRYVCVKEMGARVEGDGCKGRGGCKWIRVFPVKQLEGAQWDILVWYARKLPNGTY